MKSSTFLSGKKLGSLSVSILLLAAANVGRADLVGPYTADGNTLYLFHFSEPAGGSVTVNSGSKGGSAYSVNELAASTTPPTVTTMLGAGGYVNGATSFGNCITNPVASTAGADQLGNVVGYDYNNNGAYEGDVSSGTQSPDRLVMTNLNIGNGGQTAFTLEALICPVAISNSQEIICTDNSQANSARGFQFRVNSGGLQLQYIGGPTVQAVSGTIPSSGADAFVSGTWYHVAATYDGTTVRLYWTKLDPANGAAHLLNSGGMTLGTTQGAVSGPLVFANDNRNNSGEQFFGSIDEVRISSVARAANQMQFFSPVVTITQNPVSQNIDYNQLVTFSVGASSLTPLSYQWRFNSNSIAGATNSSYVITNVAAGDAGYFDVMVTNTAGYAATSSVARLVVGAANFLNHRYSFTTDTSDSIGGAWGTNFGNAIVSGGQLVLDGSSGTYMQLPGDLFNSANSTALTVEFWATFGANANFVRVFDFGNVNVQNNGINYVGFSPHNGSGGHQLHISPGDGTFQQQVTAAGTLDGFTMHIACIIDPPNQTLAIYTNGLLEATITNMTVNIASLNDALSYIGRSLFAADPYLNASIDELRLYNGALAGLSIKQSEDQGPDTILADGPAEFVLQPTNTSVAVGQTATFAAAAVGYLPITYQWFKSGSLVSNATNSSYSFVTVIGDDNSTVECWATNTIGVTTYVTNSTTATLSVFVPPTLAWLDGANGAADGDWNTTSLNWTNVAGGPVTTFSSLAGALFDNRGSGSPTVNLTQPLNPSKLTVNSATDYTLTSFGFNGSLTGQGNIVKQGTGKLTVDVTNNMTGGATISGGILQIGNGGNTGTAGSGPITNNATLALNRGDAFTIGNVIRGTGVLQMDGFGTVTLSGANEYSGSTLINAGIVILPNTSGLGSASGGTVVANGGQLYITGNLPIGAEALTLNGSGDINGALRKGGAGLTTYGGTVTLASDSTIGVDTGATITLTNAPGLIGSGVLTKNGAGTLAFNTANTYSSGTILDAGALNYNTAGAFGTGSVTTTPTSTGRIVLGDGTTFTNSVTTDSVNPGTALGFIMTGDNTNGTITTVSGPVTFNADAISGGSLVGPTTSGYLHFTGPVNLGGSALALSIRLGNVRFSGGGTYPEIQVRANTTSLGANNGISSTAVMDLAGNGSPTVPTYFDLNGFNQTLAGLKNTVAPANLGIVTNSGAATKTLTLDLAGNAYSFSGNLAGNLALILNSGTQILAGTNSYSGNTTINGGTLEISQPTLAAVSTVTVASGAVLQLDFAVTNKVSGLVLNGVNQPAGVYNNASSPLYLSGPGSLLVSSVATTPTNITAVVNGNQYTLSWPASHIGWQLQAQTNSLNVGLSSNWSPVPGSTTTNQISVPINPANGSVFFRLSYQ